MIILHGEQTVKSRDRLTELLQEAKDKGQDVVRLPAKEVTLASLEEAFASSSLFGTEKVLVFEELHSLPKSKKKDELLKAVAEAAQEHPDQPVIMWEKRALTATMLKPFKGATVEEFKLSQVIWKWLDSLSPAANKTKLLQDLQTIYSQDGAELCFAMLARQIRLLISAKDDGQLKGAPFMISKLRKQAAAFTLEKLLQLHRTLLEIDLAQKTSQSRLTLQQQLDLLIYSL